MRPATGAYTCPFLDDNGRCSIYEHRPIACSSYVVVTEPFMCADPDGKSGFIDPIRALKHLPGKYIKKITRSGKYDLLDVFRGAA